MLDYFDWVACEDDQNSRIEAGEAEESDFYHEPQCKECQYWFKEPEDLKRHQQEGHAHAA